MAAPSKEQSIHNQEREGRKHKFRMRRFDAARLFRETPIHMQYHCEKNSIQRQQMSMSQKTCSCVNALQPAEMPVDTFDHS
jgi:hypothetical protein